MSVWRCPHCGTPQAETARCWVCRRSSTTCSTCRHFRRSVAAQLGYCGLDARRRPLAGTELRGCWEGGPARSADALPAQPIVTEPDSGDARALRLRDFVPVELHADRRIVARTGAPRRRTGAPVAAAPAELAGEPMSAGPPAQPLADRVTLFSEPDL